MRTRKLCCATLLVLTLSAPALAGWIHAGAAPTPTPTPEPVEASPGEPTPAAIPDGEPAPGTEGVVTEVALRLAQTLLTLF